MEHLTAVERAELRSLHLPVREMSPQEARLSRQYHAGILTIAEYRAALARLP